MIDEEADGIGRLEKKEHVIFFPTLDMTKNKRLAFPQDTTPPPSTANVASPSSQESSRKDIEDDEHPRAL